MIDKTILITGATGVIGSRLVKRLCELGAFVKILSRSPVNADKIFKRQYTVQEFDWSKYDDPNKLRDLIEESDAIINLAGANVADKRWSVEYKKEIYNSRIEITKLLVKAIKICSKRPEFLINASGVGYYGFRGDEILTEDSEPGEDFLAKLCRDWESEAMKAVQFNVRVVTIRTGIVLDNKGGALEEFLKPFKFYIGAYQGTGRQWLSWIHIDDIIDLYLFAMSNSNMLGAVNGVSPESVTNKEFTEILGRVLNKNIILPVPGIILKLVVGEFANNLITGQKVSPQKIMNAGFKFKFPLLKEALENLLIQETNI
ncbi:MAG TPA: TIGR01777 family oxidoreductase [Ignavibacteria bacterium]|nr:TIGR01777 family oxidoreductase [Ignavibacteria bacterium]